MRVKFQHISPRRIHTNYIHIITIIKIQKKKLVQYITFFYGTEMQCEDWGWRQGPEGPEGLKAGGGYHWRTGGKPGPVINNVSSSESPTHTGLLKSPEGCLTSAGEPPTRDTQDRKLQSTHPCDCIYLLSQNGNGNINSPHLGILTVYEEGQAGLRTPAILALRRLGGKRRPNKIQS